MTDYSQATDFSAKDALTAGDPLKAVVGAQIDAEFDLISVAIASKFDSADLASQALAEAGTDNTVLMTPLRVSQLIAALVSTQTAYKTATETVNNSDTLQDDNHITGLTVAASGTYRVFGVIIASVLTASDLKIALTLGSAPTTINVQFAMAGNNAIARAIQTASGTGVALAANAAENVVIVVEGVIVNDTDATTLKLQWAQNTAAVEDTTLGIGSFLTLDRLA